MDNLVSYVINFPNPVNHCISVECSIKNPSPHGQKVSLPAWVPGSYKIRDFAKNILELTATSATGRQLTTKMLDKNTWQVASCQEPVIIHYRIYCFDKQPRGAYIDNTRIFLNGGRIFLQVEQAVGHACSVQINPSPNIGKMWQVITSMHAQQVNDLGFGLYTANNYLDLIDHPIQIGEFNILEFTVNKVPHKIVINQDVPGDFDRLTKDVTKICQGHANFFQELPQIDQYLFLLNALGKGYGGIEHASASSLLCSKMDLPNINHSLISDNYLSLLGLFSHEYFHAWNVKRIKPEAFINPDLSKEVYTKQLWIFEGITSYYDDFNLVRTKIIDLNRYLKLLSKSIDRVAKNPGSSLQTLEQSSFEAWTKFYQADENAPNALVSYYTKGSIVALALDLMILKDTAGKKSLADVMQVMWQKFAKKNLGLAEKDFEKIVLDVTGHNYTDFFDLALRSTAAIPLVELLAEVGVAVKKNVANDLESMGVRLFSDTGMATVQNVLSDHAAEHAGIAANDIIIAINNHRVTQSNILELLNYYRPQDVLKLHVFRNDQLMSLELIKPYPLHHTCDLQVMQQISSQQKLMQERWLKNYSTS